MAKPGDAEDGGCGGGSCSSASSSSGSSDGGTRGGRGGGDDAGGEAEGAQGEISVDDLLRQFKEEDRTKADDGDCGADLGAAHGLRCSGAEAIAQGLKLLQEAVEDPPKAKKKKKKQKKSSASGATAVETSEQPEAAGAEVDPVAAARPAVARSAAARAGEEAAPVSRQQEILARRVQLDQKERETGLSVQDVADYEIFVQNIHRSMEAEGQQMQQKYRLTEARLKHTRDSRRLQLLGKEIERLKRLEEQFNADVAFINKEVDSFHNSSAYKLARGHVFENFEKTSKGKWVTKKDKDLRSVAEDSLPDIATLLDEMKHG